MPKSFKYVPKSLVNQIMGFYGDTVGSGQIAAVAVVGECILSLDSSEAIVEALAIVRSFQPRFMSYTKVLDERNCILLAVEKWVFERDVDGGFLGEALAEKMIFPYIPLADKDYLHNQEIRLKKRLVQELLENLVLEFPELSYSLRIKPEYFMQEAMMNRARLFPPMVDNVLSFLHLETGNRSKDSVMNGYLKALKELKEEGLVESSEDGCVTISRDFVEKIQVKKTRFVNIFKTARRALFTSMLGTFSKTLGLVSQGKRTFPDLGRNLWSNSESIHQFEDSHKYLYIPTARGLFPLALKMDIEAFARKVLSKGKEPTIETRKIGGVLNDVYLLETFVNHKEEKIVVKRFKDWSSFKWFPINLWTLGTKTFAVLGNSRMERECAMNQLLREKGINVPEILFVSHAERLVFMEHVEGEKLHETIKRISGAAEDVEEDLSIIARVGATLAEVHSLGIVLGDTKPENIVVQEESRDIYLLDLEQASRKGDKVWDIAEFLYYSGHYFSPISGTRLAELTAKAFVKGYIGKHGDVGLVQRVGSPKYTKVFSLFTFPHIILAISKICRSEETAEN